MKIKELFRRPTLFKTIAVLNIFILFLSFLSAWLRNLLIIDFDTPFYFLCLIIFISIANLYFVIRYITNQKNFYILLTILPLIVILLLTLFNNESKDIIGVIKFKINFV